MIHLRNCPLCFKALPIVQLISIRLIIEFLGWCCYCYGKDFWGTISKAKKDNEDESDCTSGDDSIQDHNKPSSAFNDLADGQKPLTSIITQLKQTELVCLLEFQISWVELVGVLREDQGLWLYSLMAGLDKPPHPDVTR